MTAAVQIALTATPLAGYFYALGLFHSGRRPRLVPGPLDVGLMAFGLGGLIAFGPFGRSVLGRLVGAEAGPLAWSVWVAVVALWSLALAGSAGLRVTVYHLTAGELDRAVREALAGAGGRFTPTLNGFEDAARGAGILVRSVPRLRVGTVEAYGRDPEVLMAELKPRIRDALARLPQGPSRVSHAMFGLACLAMLVPVTGFFLSNSRARDALRVLMHSLRWW
jgi:hypothetical protein